MSDFGPSRQTFVEPCAAASGGPANSRVPVLGFGLVARATHSLADIDNSAPTTAPTMYMAQAERLIDGAYVSAMQGDRRVVYTRALPVGVVL